MDDPVVAVPPMIILMSPMGGSRMVVFLSGGLFPKICIHSLLVEKLLQLSFFDKGLDLLLEVITISRVMTMVTVEAAILVS